MMRLSLPFVFVFLTSCETAKAIRATSTTDPNALANALLAANGATVISATLVGGSTCAGLFTGGSAVVPGDPNAVPDSGVILSSGNVVDIADPNDSDDTTTSFFFPGDSDLSSLVGGSATTDACVLTVTFECPAGIQGGEVTFDYVFGSEEYNEFVNSFNDVFGFFLNGVNVALIPSTNTPVSINNVNKNANSFYFRNNDITDFGTPTPFAIEADGFTKKLTATGPAVLGVNTLKFAIADAIDTEFDSWALIQGGSFTCATPSCSNTKYYIWKSAVDQEDQELTNGWVGCIKMPFNLEGRLCKPPKTLPVLFKLYGRSVSYVARGQETEPPYFLFGNVGTDVKNNPTAKNLTNGDYSLYVTVDNVTSIVNFTQACP